MNSVVIVGRVCTTPLYFPEIQGQRSSSLYFCVAVGLPGGKNGNIIDFFNVRCRGAVADRNAGKVQRSQIVCVRGSVHLDSHHVSMFIRPDPKAGIEIYTKLPSLYGTFDPALGRIFSKPRERFLEAVEACEEGGRIYLDKEIRVLQPKEIQRRSKKNKRDPNSKSEDHLSQEADLTAAFSDVPDMSASFDDDDTPILPSYEFWEGSVSAPNESGPAFANAASCFPKGAEEEDALVDDDPWGSYAKEELQRYREAHEKHVLTLSMAVPPPRIRKTLRELFNSPHGEYEGENGEEAESQVEEEPYALEEVSFAPEEEVVREENTTD